MEKNKLTILERFIKSVKPDQESKITLSEKEQAQILNNIEKIRNFGIIAHIDSGKTTITERILFFGKKKIDSDERKIHKINEVHGGGGTKTDFMEQEKQKGITITAAAVTCFHKNSQLNLIDTPGHVDFTIEVERSLRVLDGMVLAFDSVSGVQAQSKTVWFQAQKYEVPGIFFINKLDRMGADFYKCVEQIKEKLHPNPLILSIPVYDDKPTFLGTICLITMKYLFWTENDDLDYEIKEIPEHMKNIANKYREEMEASLDIIDAIVDDNEYDMHFLEQSYINDPFLKIKKSIRKGVLSRELMPVLCGAALKNKGIQPLMDAIVDYLPCPLDRRNVKANLITKSGEFVVDSENNQVKRQLYSDPTAKTCAFVFKTFYMPKIGRLSFIRVYSGVVEKGLTLFNSSKNREERVSRLVRMDANKTEDIELLGAGDIGAIIVKSADINTCDTLSDPSEMLKMEGITITEPVCQQELETKNQADFDKLISALSNFVQDDPSAKFSVDSDTKRVLLGGIGKLHLEILVDRLRTEYNLQVTTHVPQVSYKGTIANEVSSPADLRYEHKKQSGGAGEYALIYIKAYKRERGTGVSFVNNIVGGVIPTEFMKSVEKGVRAGAELGLNRKFPLVDIEFVVYDGRYHEVDSNSYVFEKAARDSVGELMKKAQVQLLEPFMKAEIVTKPKFVGTITGDIASKKGKINTMVDKGGDTIIEAYIPLSETFNYIDGLRAIASGEASVSFEFHKYEIVPEASAVKILKET